jgi:hypothetical protein
MRLRQLEIRCAGQKFKLSKVDDAINKNAKGQYVTLPTPQLIARKTNKKIIPLCLCCKQEIKGRKNVRACSFCVECAEYLSRLREKRNSKICRSKKILRAVQEMGGVGRIKQKMAFNKVAHKKIDLLRSQVCYYKKLVDVVVEVKKE